MESDKSDNIKKETQNNTDKNWVNSINPQDRHAGVVGVKAFIDVGNKGKATFLKE